MERKADRLQKEASKIRGIRRQIIHSRYKEYQRTLHPSRWKYIPQTLEIIGYEPFARHVNAPVEAEVTAATFDDAFAHFPQLMIAAMEERKTSLRDLLPRDENSGANHDPMDLATAAFRCEEEDSVFLFGWDEIASHHCREQDGVLNYNADLQPKTTTPSVGYSPLAANVIKKVIDVVGWDCATATPSELDNRDLRFSCDSCGSHTEGGWIHYEVGYDWRTLVRLQSSQFFYDKQTTRLRRPTCVRAQNLITQISVSQSSQVEKPRRYGDASAATSGWKANGHALTALNIWTTSKRVMSSCNISVIRAY